MVLQRSMLALRRGWGSICHGYMCIVLYVIYTISIRSNLLITISYYKLLNAIATMVLKCMKFTCPTDRKLIHV